MENSNVIVKVFSQSKHKLPAYETIGSVGMDVRANNVDELYVIILPQSRTVVKTGLFVEIPVGYEIQVRPRSGLAAKKGVSVLNTPGTIDADYRGEIMVILQNNSDQPYFVEDGERVAQLVLSKKPRMELVPVVTLESLSSTDRGAGGLGSTDKKKA